MYRFVSGIWPQFAEPRIFFLFARCASAYFPAAILKTLPHANG